MKSNNRTATVVTPAVIPADALTDSPEFKAALDTFCGTIRAHVAANPSKPQAKHNKAFRDALDAYAIASEKFGAHRKDEGKKFERLLAEANTAHAALIAVVDALIAEAAK